jgi:hypothetical protein
VLGKHTAHVRITHHRKDLDILKSHSVHTILQEVPDFAKLLTFEANRVHGIGTATCTRRAVSAAMEPPRE